MLCGKMSVDYCEKRMEDTNMFVGKVQKLYRDGDVACHLSVHLNCNEQRRNGAKSFLVKERNVKNTAV